MNKRERVLNAMNNQPVDRVPVGFWFHFPEDMDLKKLAYEKNKCIIFSSHDLQVSLDVSDRIWIMGNAGFTEGSPSEVLEGNKLNGIFSDSRIRYDNDKNKFVYNNGI